MTIRQLLQELSFIKINNIKRNAKGLLLALEDSNRKEFLDYEVEEKRLCDNTDCPHKNKQQVYQVELHSDFNNESCYWCKDCILRDAEMIKWTELYH